MKDSEQNAQKNESISLTFKTVQFNSRWESETLARDRTTHRWLGSPNWWKFKFTKIQPHNKRAHMHHPQPNWRLESTCTIRSQTGRNTWPREGGYVDSMWWIQMAIKVSKRTSSVVTRKSDPRLAPREPRAQPLDLWCLLMIIWICAILYKLCAASTSRK